MIHNQEEEHDVPRCWEEIICYKKKDGRENMGPPNVLCYPPLPHLSYVGALATLQPWRGSLVIASILLQLQKGQE